MSPHLSLGKQYNITRFDYSAKNPVTGTLIVDTLNTNTTLVVSPPRNPPAPALLKKISTALKDLEAVREAHLPEVIEIGVTTKPRFILFAVVESSDKIDAVQHALNKQLSGRFRLGTKVEFKVVTSDYPQLEDIRETDSLVGWRD